MPNRQLARNGKPNWIVGVSLTEDRAQEPARSAKTEAAYARRAKQLLARFSADDRYTGDWRDDPMEFCRWFSELRNTLVGASWRQYRAAMVYFMERHGPRECVRYLHALPPAPARPALAGRRIRCGKTRRLAPDELRQILDALSPTARRWDRLLGLWLVAGVLTGLRPCEWADACLEGYTLFVRNAKATHGRAPGVNRRLDLRAMSDFERESVRAMTEAVGALENFEVAYAGCRLRLARVVRRLWPRRRRRPSLYSARHQFRADLASAGRSAVEQAALMGHISTRTAEWHYGRRCHGSGRAPIGADPRCVEIIEHHEHQRQSREPSRDETTGGSEQESG
jgi:hypothetical protein